MKELIEKWEKRKVKYDDLALKYKDNEHNYKKFTYKAMAIRDCIKDLKEQCDIRNSCEKLKEKEVPTIEDWLKDNFKRLDRHSFTNANEDTIWLRSELIEIYNAIHI